MTPSAAENSADEEIKERIATVNRAYRVHKNRAHRVHNKLFTSK